jgi:hypothetical protein
MFALQFFLLIFDGQGGVFKLQGKQQRPKSFYLPF